MPKSAPFAVSFLSALLALPMLAADLRPVRDPYLIEKGFPAKARVRVLNLWATWCAPCVAEMADLRAVDDLFGREVAFVGVSFDAMLPDAKQDKVASFLDKQKITWPNFYYTGNADTIGDYFDFRGELPLTVVYDGAQKELWRHAGRIDKNTLIAQVRAALGRKP